MKESAYLVRISCIMCGLQMSLLPPSPTYSTTSNTSFKNNQREEHRQYYSGQVIVSSRSPAPASHRNQRGLSVIVTVMWSTHDLCQLTCSLHTLIALLYSLSNTSNKVIHTTSSPGIGPHPSHGPKVPKDCHRSMCPHDSLSSQPSP